MKTFWERFRRRDTDVVLRQLPAKHVALDVAASVGRAAYPGHSRELLETLQERAAAEITAATPLELDPNASAADSCTIEQFEALRADVARARERHAAARLRHDEAKITLQGLGKPLGIVAHTVRLLVVLVILVIIVGAIAALLAPSIDAFLLRGYINHILQNDDERFSAVVAFYLALACAAALFGAQLAAVIVSRGRVHWTRKFTYIVADIAFAGAFAAMRLSETFSWQATCVSIFEFALSIGGTALVLDFGSVLRKNVGTAEVYKAAKQRSLLAGRAEREAEKVIKVVRDRLERLCQQIAHREDGVRRHTRFVELGRASAKASYLTEAAALVDANVRDESAEAAVGRIEGHLNDAFARIGVRRGAG